MPAEEIHLDVRLVKQLVATQFPQWADLPIVPVERDGWDNRTFRLGESMKVRLPSAERYAAQVKKEHEWLPRLAPHLPLPTPAPLALGTPGGGYPWSWSISTWLPGDTAAVGRIDDLQRFAIDLAQFLVALEKVDSIDGPPPGAHNFFRGGPLMTYDSETRRAISALADQINSRQASAVWTAALDATWTGRPVWVHGDVSAGNLLVEAGRLSAVIDFGTCGVGDPACDLVVAWNFFEGASRDAFVAALSMEEATWARARGWALWKALITLAANTEPDPTDAVRARRVIDAVLAEHAMRWVMPKGQASSR